MKLSGLNQSSVDYGSQDQSILLRKQKYFEDEKQRAEYHEHLKKVLLKTQQDFFTKLVHDSDKNNIQIAEKAVTKVTQKIHQHLEEGTLDYNANQLPRDITLKHLYDYKQKQKKLISDETDLGLDKLDNQISQSQPTLKLLVNEEQIHKQKEARTFITRVKNKEHQTKEEFEKKKNFEKEKELERLKLEKQRIQEEEFKNKVQKQEKISNHIEEIKQKHQTRLKEMMKFEEDYFKTLDGKLKKLKEARAHIKDLDYGHVKLITGIRPREIQTSHDSNGHSSSTPHFNKIPNKTILEKIPEKSSNKGVNKNNQVAISPEKTQPQQVKRENKTASNDKFIKSLEIEQPLYQRYRKEFRIKMKQEEQKSLKEFDSLQDHRKKYTHFDINSHVEEYQKKKNEFRKKYETRRLENLKSLGLIDGAPKGINVSFDSKLWMIDKGEKEQPEEIKKKLQEKQLKMKSYVEQVRENDLFIADEEKKLEILVAKDKLLNPQRYIRPLQRKRKDIVIKSDQEIYLESLEQEEKKLEPAEFYEHQRNLGKNYLSELADNIPIAREELKKLRLKNGSVTNGAQSVDLRSINTEYDYHNPRRYMDDARKHLKVEDKEKKLNWQTILEEEDQKNTERIKIEIQSDKNATPQKNTLENEIGYKKNISNRKKLDELKNLQRQPITAEKINQVAANIDKYAKQKEYEALLKWQKDPVAAVEQGSNVDDLMVDSIKAKIKILELKK